MGQDGEWAPAMEGMDAAAATWRSHSSHRTWKLVTEGGMRDPAGIPAYTRALTLCER